MKKKIIAIILCLSILLNTVPLHNVVANDTNSHTSESMNYGSVIGNTAQFNVYFPIPISNDPSNVKNPWGTDCEFLSEGEMPNDFIMIITNYYCSDSGEIWYQVGAAPGYELPEKLQKNPWVYQDNVNMPLGESLIIHSTGRNFVLDEEGNVVTSANIGLYNTVNLECSSSLIGTPQYKWQILVNEEWTNIVGEVSPMISVDYPLVSTAMDSNQQVKIRCLAKSGSKQVVGEPITVFVDTYFDYDSYVHPEKEEETSDTKAKLLDSASHGSTSNQSGTNVCYITVQFLFGNGNQAANSYVAEVPVGVESSIVVDFPYVQGYLPYYEGVRQDQITISGVFEGNEVYTVNYEPTLVDYTVDIYFQNIENDEYSFYDSRTYQGLTGAKVPLNTQAFVGMHELLHETPIIAADGSTHVEVYYDRLYFMTRVYLMGGFGIYSVYARYGADLQGHLSAPTRPGYSFVGWDEYTIDSDNDGVPDTGGNNIVDTVYPTVPAKNLAYVALWKENATAQVNIVFWGENPNDTGYSYLDTKELYVKPGTELTYALSGGYVCGLEAHKHGNGCTTSCGMEAHTHSEEMGCYKDTEHKHEADCYTVTYRSYGGNQEVSLNRVTNTTTIATLENATVWQNGVVGISSGWYNYNYYMNLEGVWYQLTRNSGISIDAGTTVNWSHKSSCPGIHTHNEDCLTCTQAEHIHDGSCYNCVEHTHSQATCGYPTFEGYDSSLWTLVKTDTVTVQRNGSTILNVYFNRTTFTLTFRYNNSTVATIKEKWGASISDEFEKAPFNTTYNGYAWECTDTSKYSYALQTLDIMPRFDATFNRYKGSSSSLNTIYYYVQKPGTVVSESSWPSNQDNFTLLKQVDTYFGYATYNEEYHEMVGYKRYSKTVAGFGSSNNRKDFSSRKLYLYYLVDSFSLEFFSGNDVVRTEATDYEQPLSIYSGYIPPLPAEYEAESHDFVGWYLNPECTGNPVDLNTAKMPAGALALYAKWVPKYHTVRIVLEKKDNGIYGPEDSVLESGGEKIEYLEVLHGTTVFSTSENKTPPVPQNGLYKFLGWFYMDDNVELMWDFEHHPIVKDTVIYAKWSSEVMVPYTIYYKDVEGNEIAPPLISSSLAGHSLTVKAKVGNELNEEYRNKYFPQVVSHSISLDIDKADAGVEYTFVYEKAENKKYYVHYVDADNGNVELTNSPVEKDSEYAVVTETYKYFDGYVPDAYQKTLILSSNEGENHVFFYYTKAQDKGVWFVGHYVENKDVLGQYDTHSTSGDVDKLGEEIIATWPVDLSKDGFAFSHAIINDGKNIQTVTSIDEAKGNITKAGLMIEVYYTRIKYPYKVVYRNKDTGLEIHEPDIFVGDHMEPYGKTVTLDTLPSIEGYEYASSGSCTIVKDNEENITKNIIYVYYTEQTIRIDFKVVGPNGCGTVNPESLFVKYVSDHSATATATPSENCRFVGWYYDVACNHPIVTSDTLKPNGDMMILQKGDAWAPATYYAKFELGAADLTIKRENAETGQVYIYEVKNTVTNEIIYVTVAGNAQVIIHDLNMGEYTVTQLQDWSWRYNDSSQKVNHQSADGTIVTFGNSSTTEQWLNGNSPLIQNQRR